MLHVVADRDVFAVSEALQGRAGLSLVPGRQISREHLSRADALLVRSITRVNRELLDGTPVRWVGTATSGTDHIDLAYLREQSIHLCDAAGANAEAVVEYVFAALACWALETGSDPLTRIPGIIGAGNVGGQLAVRLKHSGFEPVVCDPLLAPQKRHELETAGLQFVSLAEALEAGIVSLHVPLTLAGPHATFKMLGKDQLAALKQNTVLINTARGEVIDSMALAEVLALRQDLFAILDVWEGEPRLDARLVNRARLASPHIAGYSSDAKLRATARLLEDFSRFFETEISDGMIPLRQEYLAPVSLGKVNLSPSDRLCNGVLSRILPLSEIDRDLRSSLASPADAVAQFDAVRKKLTRRREFSACRLDCGQVSQSQQALLRALGFRLSQP